MAKTSTYGFGGLGISFSEKEISTGSEYFTQEGLEGALGTEVARGTFSVDDGLTAFDSSSIFAADSGPLTASTNIEQNTEAPAPSPPSTRPYIWKYQ